MSRVRAIRSPVDLDLLDDAADLLLAGGVILFPTDTVYGLGACAENLQAVERIFELKGRRSESPLPVLVGSFEAARRIAQFTPVAERLAMQHWPGPLTLVLARRTDFTAYLGGDPDTVGVRIPAAEIVQLLAERCGPLASTSANISGEAEMSTASQAQKVFGDRVDLYLEADTMPGGKSSTVVDARSQLEILRAGALDLGEALNGF